MDEKGEFETPRRNDGQIKLAWSDWSELFYCEEKLFDVWGSNSNSVASKKKSVDASDVVAIFFVPQICERQVLR